jgi:hypothetical protein
MALCGPQTILQYTKALRFAPEVKALDLPN